MTRTEILKIICTVIMIAVAIKNTKTTLEIKRIRKKVQPAEWLIVVLNYICVVLLIVVDTMD